MTTTTPNKAIPEILERLAEVRTAKAEVKSKLDSIQAVESELRDEVFEELQKVGLKSAKTSDGRFGATITERAQVQLIDEAKAIEWIKKNRLGVEHYTGLKWTAFKPLAEKSLMETGEIVPGTQASKIEYISFRENKPKEKEKK